MRRHLALTAVGVLALTGAAAAHPVTGMTALFPDARTEPKIERGGVTLKFGNSSLYLTPVRFQPLPDRPQPRNAFWCGVGLSAGGTATQAVVTVGKGVTEVLSCQGLIAAGVVPPNGRTRRIGLIYDLNSPNTDFRGAIVLARDPASGRWSVDESLLEELDRRGRAPKTIAALRNALGAR